jgi:hypothetical protein
MNFIVVKQLNQSLTKKVNFIERLPVELLGYIFDQPELSFFDLIRCRGVRQHWRDVISKHAELRKKLFSMQVGDIGAAIDSTPHCLAFRFYVNRNTFHVTLRHHRITVPVNLMHPRANDPPAQVTFHPLLADLFQHVDLLNRHFKTTRQTSGLPHPTTAGATGIDIDGLTTVDQGLPRYWVRNHSAEIDLLVKLSDQNPLHHLWHSMFISSPPLQFFDVAIYLDTLPFFPSGTLLARIPFHDPSGIKLGTVIQVIQVWIGRLRGYI